MNTVGLLYRTLEAPTAVLSADLLTNSCSVAAAAATRLVIGRQARLETYAAAEDGLVPEAHWEVPGCVSNVTALPDGHILLITQAGECCLLRGAADAASSTAIGASSSRSSSSAPRLQCCARASLKDANAHAGISGLQCVEGCIISAPLVLGRAQQLGGSTAGHGSSTIVLAASYSLGALHFISISRLDSDSPILEVAALPSTRCLAACSGTKGGLQ